MFITVDDFTGKYELHTGMYAQSNISDYIDKYEKLYLIDLFGATLYDLFVSDLDVNNVPKSPAYIKVFNPFHEDVTLYTTLVSNGIKEMLLGFIYFEYCKDNMNQMTIVGQTRPKNENSQVVNTLQTLIYTRYNEAVKTFTNIQEYILLNYTTYGSECVLVSLTNGGTGYTTDGQTFFTNVNATYGSGATCEYESDGNEVTSIQVSNGGKGYQIGDELLLNAGDLNATCEVTYIGLSLDQFNGKPKQYAYWL